MTTARAGTTLGNRYDVLELLGTGGMGEVYRAHDRELDELVALKLIHTTYANDLRVLERFRNEVKLARRVTHRNVARTFELGHTSDAMFCTMELVEGESLRDRTRRGARFNVVDAVALVDEVCAGLAAAHAVGVIHRDIKPANILLANDGRIVIADFGVASLAALTTGESSGTPEYMAPEQARGEPPTPATDIYALGVVLFELLTGRQAFAGDTEHVLCAKEETAALHVAGIAPELAAVIARATAREPIDRPASVVAFRQLLAPWRGGELPGASSPRAAGLELQDVVVVAPRAAGGDDAHLHIADGVYQAVLASASRLPRLRVIARPDASAPRAATVIDLVAGEQLAVTIRHGDAVRALALPLAIRDIDLAAAAIVAALVSILGRGDVDETALEARELALRAQLLAGRGLATAPATLSFVERAWGLCPDDPAIAALHAVMFVRHAVLGGEATDAAIAVVRHALAIAPEQANSHVAAGNLELNIGEPRRAAAHFRAAIACSRHVAEGHGGLGWMLLEAGYLGAARSRIDDALAIAPQLTTLKWNLARAHALEADWDAHDRLAATLVGPADRLLPRLRHLRWRGDDAGWLRLQPLVLAQHEWEPQLIQLLLADPSPQAWWKVRAEAFRLVRTVPRVRLRRAFVDQLVAEVAAAAGDLDGVVEIVEDAADHGLFDRHWMDRCPTLEAARRSGRLAPARATIARRAEEIYDALYGERDAAETVVERKR